jgi:hypothetical protein
MTIIRAPRPEIGYAIIRNETIRDQVLSYRARGLLSYLLSMPDDWVTSTERLQGACTEGRDAIRAAIKELEAAGYMVLEKTQDARGRWSSRWTVYDKSHKSAVERLGEIRESQKYRRLENRHSVDQALKEELITNDLGKDSQRYLGSRDRVCGQCNGTGMDLDYQDQPYPCPECRGDGLTRPQ